MGVRLQHLLCTNNMGLYGVAKVTTILEICLTCNWLLFYELYGIVSKKSVWIIVGIVYRSLEILLFVILCWVLLGLADNKIDISHMTDGTETDDELTQLINNTEKDLEQAGISLNTIYQILGGIFVFAALLNIAKIYLLYLVHLKIKEEDEQMRNQMANQNLAPISNSVQPIQSWS